MIPRIEPHHVELLRLSAIPLALAELAGVRSLCAADAEDAGFGEKAGPGLAFPYRDPGTGATIQGFLRLRRDHPNGTGRYLQPRGSKNRLYIPTATPDELRDTNLVVIWTEGERKALSLIAWCERQKLRHVVIGIGGVWSWRFAEKGLKPDGSLGKVGSKAIEDLGSIAWTGRRVIIVFDSDVMRSVAVSRALRRLTRHTGLITFGPDGHGALVPSGWLT